MPTGNEVIMSCRVVMQPWKRNVYTLGASQITSHSRPIQVQVEATLLQRYAAMDTRETS